MNSHSYAVPACLPVPAMPFFRAAVRQATFGGALLFGLAGALSTTQAAAQTDPCAGTLSPSAIVGCLRPESVGSGTRGIRPSVSPPAPGKTAPPHQATTADGTVNLTVTFDFNSAELTPQGAAALVSLGSALKDPALTSARFLIGGHTDAAGTVGYNQMLSERRAETARRFLIEHAGVDPSRLTAVGFGPSRLYDASNPLSAANRRVQVSRL